MITAKVICANCGKSELVSSAILIKGRAFCGEKCRELWIEKNATK